MSTGEPTDRAGSRFVITHGGEPGPEQLAALVIALTPSVDAATSTRPPAWRQAALLEGIGGARVLTPGDLDAAFRDRH